MFYLFLADGFEEVEALAPLDILRRCDIDILTVGVGSATVKGSHGVAVLCDITVDKISLNDCTGVILPGGLPGTTNLAASREVCDTVSAVAGKGGLVCAICAAPSVIGDMGLLKGERATCYPGYEAQLIGATVASEPVVKSGNFITARGAGVALEFGFMIAEQLKGAEFVEKLRAAMQCVQ